jgi:hypothetical protein
MNAICLGSGERIAKSVLFRWAIFISHGLHG